MSIYLIPCPIAEDKINTIPLKTIEKLHSINHFVVERAKTARHFIKEAGHPLPISDLSIFEIDKHDPDRGLMEFLNDYVNHHDIGVISEAGCPGIADPGAKISAWAHMQRIEVIPLVGPSSILLALMASGFSGQAFTFHGYLPHKRPELIKKLRFLEREVQKFGSTQIFMETPYRNQNILNTCCDCLNPSTNLSIAVDITSDEEFIQTQKISTWKSFDSSALHKRPAIFLLGKT